MKTVDCVSLVVLREGKILVERRREDRETHPGAVVIPGGHLEGDESFTDACRKELKEELGLDCKEFRFLAEALVPTDVELQKTRWYVCMDWEGEPVCNEADEVFWIGLDELFRLDFEYDREAASTLSTETSKN